MVEKKTQAQIDKDQLALERTEMAGARNVLARIRTVQSAERTYAAWLRTGFAIAGAGWTVGVLFFGRENSRYVFFLSGTLIALGILCFIYAWVGYRRSYKFVYNFCEDMSPNDPLSDRKMQQFNFRTVTILTLALTLVFILSFITIVLE